MKNVDVECAFLCEVDIDHPPFGHGIQLWPGDIGERGSVEGIDNIFIDEGEKYGDAQDDLPILNRRLDKLGSETDRDCVCRHVEVFRKHKGTEEAQMPAYKAV